MEGNNEMTGLSPECPEGRGKIRIVLITGFLGAGKTTLLGEMLSNPFFGKRKTAVLVNEFGSLPVDGKLLPQEGHHIVELASGSIFCVCVKAELLKDLERIAIDIGPEYLLIEATGVAEPRDISSLLQTEFLRGRYGESVVIAVVDSINYPKLAGIVPALAMQAKMADIILINKTDLAGVEDVDRVECEIRRLNPGALVERTVNSRFNFRPEDLFAKHRLNESGKDFALCSEAPKNTFSCEFRSDSVLDRIKFYGILDEHRGDILRGKGVADFGGGRTYVEVINGVVSSRPGDGIRFDSGYRTLMSFVLRNIGGEFFRDKLLGAEK